MPLIKMAGGELSLSRGQISHLILNAVAAPITQSRHLLGSALRQSRWVATLIEVDALS